MFLFFLWSFCAFADVAFVEFTSGDLTGSIRFEQDENSDEVTITSNVLDNTNTHGASIAWTIYSDYVDTTNGGTCADKGTVLLDLTNLLESELRIGYTSYTTEAFDVADLFSSTLVLGLDVACSGVDEIAEAVRLYSTISWDAAVGNDVIESARAKTAETFEVETSRVLAVPYYPVTVDSTLTNVPESTTDENLAGYVVQSLRLILDLSEIDDVDVTITPSSSPTEKDVEFVVTSYTNGTYVFIYEHISNSPSFLPQLIGSINVYGAVTENTIWLADMVINNVDLKTTIALATTDVSDETFTAIDIEDRIPDYEANLATIDPPGTLLEYTIHSETKAPSTSPSHGPSVVPSKSPSTMPTVVPSDFPSTKPSVAPVCGPDNTNYLGDPLIQLSDDQSRYASGNFEMTVVFPPKYRADSFKFVGDTQETFTYTNGDSNEAWSSSQQKCLMQFMVTIPWSAIKDGSVGIIWNGETTTFDGVLGIHLKETITAEGSQTLGSNFERDVEYEMPFSILMHTSIVAEADLSISMSDPSLTSKVLNGLQVVVPDGANPSVTVLFCTEIPYPWVLEVPDPSTDFTLVGTDVVDATGALDQISQENCDTFGEDCRQCWQATWEVSNVCQDTENGEYTITIPAQYLKVPPYQEEVNVDVTMRLALMPACQVTVASVEPTGSLVMYPDDTYSASSIVFYIDSEAWGRITIDAFQDIEALTLDSLLVKQDGVSQTLQTTAFEYEEVARTTGDIATIDFKNRFTITELKGEITGKPTVITADLTITYVDGTRRRLQVTTGENDVPTEVDASSTIVLLEGPCKTPAGRLDELRYEPCADSSDNQIMRCLATGWNMLVGCPGTSPTETETDVVLQVDTQEESLVSGNDDGNTWKNAVVVLGIIIALCLMVYMLLTVTECCSTRKGETYSFEPASQQAVDKI